MKNNATHYLNFSISKLEIFTPIFEPLTLSIQFGNFRQSLDSLTDPQVLNHFDQEITFETALPFENPQITIWAESCDHFPCKLASSQINLNLIKFPFNDWISLQSKIDPNHPLYARVFLKVSMAASRTDNNEVNGERIFDSAFNAPSSSPVKSKRNWLSLLKKGLEPYIGSLVVENFPQMLSTDTLASYEEVSSFQTQDYQSKLYIFGDDGTPRIIEFDYEREDFRELEVPHNLLLYGYSMAQGLPNGSVILTGGINKFLNTIVPTAFWYEPVTNTARTLPNMDQPRYTHSMAYMDGQVYVIGGRYYGKDALGVLSHCERFDLNTKQWMRIADLNEKRCTASSVAYKGHVYVFGGFQGVGRLKCIEKYSPLENKWEILNLQMPAAIEAGFCEYVGDGKIVYIGGKNDANLNVDVNIYDIETLQSECAGKLTTGRVLPKYGFYKDKIYVFGGKSCTWEKASLPNCDFEFGGDYSHITNSEMKIFACATTSEYIGLNKNKNIENNLYIFGTQDKQVILEYVPKTQTWQEKSPPSNMKLYHESMSVPLPNGYILVFGGRNQEGTFCSKTAYLYNPKNNTCLFARMMNKARYAAAVIHIDGFVYVLGGKQANGIVLSSCERYNMRDNTWTELDKMIESRSDASVEVTNDHLYIFGGCQGENMLSSIEKYSIKGDSWKILHCKIPFSAPKIYSCVMKDQNILIFGKDLNQQAIFNAEKLDVKNHKILPKALSFNHCVFNNSKLYLFGGETNTSQYITFESGKVGDKWTQINSCPSQMLNHIKEGSITHNLEFEGKQPLGFGDELILGTHSERNASMFIFAREKNDSKILEYNLKTQQFSEIQVPKNMKINEYAAAVGLPDSTIILTGGISLERTHAYVNNSTISYIPFSNTFKKLNPMMKCRYQHGLVFYQGYIYAIGGQEYFSNSNSYLKHCERLNLKTLCWEEAPALNIARSNFAICCLDKSIYVFGGRNKEGLLCEIERYKGGKTWESLGKFSLPYPLEGAVAVPMSYNQIYLFGGRTFGHSSNEVIAIQPSNEIIEVGSRYMVHHRNMCKAALHGNNLFVIGGNSTVSSEMSIECGLNWKPFSSYENIIQSDLKSAAFAVSKIDMNLTLMAQGYEPKEFNYLYIFGSELNPKVLRLSLADQKWEQLKLPSKLKLWDYSVALSLPNGKIFLTGGINCTLSSIKQCAYLLDFSQSIENACEVLEPMIQGRYTHTSCYHNNYVYVMGGRHYGKGIDGVLNTCERYHLPTKKWESIAPLRSKRCTGVATTYMNRVYIFGGYRGDGRIMTIERYNEVVNVWESVPLLLMYPIEAEGMVKLSEKEIVLLGGKDDFSEQAYVSTYDLERNTSQMEKSLMTKRILCKTAVYKDEIYVIGGDAAMTCEKAKIGEWNWKKFESYSSLFSNNLAKASAAQGR